ncbi:MAG: DUF362 domain-containing protein [Calditrichaeota bacterium]|nr:MAG: DUF362 domain-containing protein [Calditrichota bacterium]
MMKKMVKKLSWSVIGLASLIWFLLRVIPKPSRAAYPCMRAAAPIASSFVLYILATLTSIVFFKKAKKFLHQSRFVLFTLALLLGMIFGISSLLHSNHKAYALIQSPVEGANQPMGVGQGIYAGRVVWIHNPDATDQTCKNSKNDYWWQDDNSNQAVITEMLSNALHLLSGKNSDAEAWDAIFHNFNQSRHKGDVGYKSGEKIVIKINLNSGAGGSTVKRGDNSKIDTSPQVVYAILRQLINVVGVAQADISFGDPGRNVDDIFWNKFHAEFPEVKYWGNGSGRTPIVKSSRSQVFTSDGSMTDFLPTAYLEAAYMINVPVLKKHHRGGISLSSKNHFGTFVPFHGSAFHWHFSLPASEGGGDVNNGDYGLYRCFVDFMGHKDIGGKTILYIVDGIWGSTNWAHPPIKWRMAPFNNDWPSSIFISQDPVAIESVGFDFLFTEFDENHPSEGAYDPSDNKGPFPHYAGTDDFLHQAADSTNWPTDLKYDPENDGTSIRGTLGVHEHWNNPLDKQYSRNLGLDRGIELVSNENPSAETEHPSEQKGLAGGFLLQQNYPNPFNPATEIGYDIPALSDVQLSVYNAVGQHIATLVNEQQIAGHYTTRWDGKTETGSSVPGGIYFYRLHINNESGLHQSTRKMTLTR